MQVINDARAQQGRYGDTQLVALNPHEHRYLAGLAALSNHPMTTNPQTGIAEAWNLSNVINPVKGIQGVISGDNSHTASGVPWGQLGTGDKVMRLFESPVASEPGGGAMMHYTNSLGGYQGNTDAAATHAYNTQQANQQTQAAQQAQFAQIASQLQANQLAAQQQPLGQQPLPGDTPYPTTTFAGLGY